MTDTNPNFSKCVTVNFTHLFLCSSRGGGLQQRIDPSTNSHWIVRPGGKIVPLAHKGRNLLRSHPTPKEVTITFIAGIPDISEKINNRAKQYTETVYRENLDITIARFNEQISQAIYILKTVTSDIAFSTIAPIDLQIWNRTQLKKRKTTYLLYENEYEFMTDHLKETIITINSIIKETNKENNMFTPYLDSAVQKYYKEGQYRYFLNRLHDGVHGGEGVKIIWARLLTKFIKKSSTNFIKLVNTEDSEEEINDKRSWRDERAIVP